MKLTNSYRIKLNDNDLALLKRLKELKVKPSVFIRQAFREKIQRELPKMLEKENEEYCPF